jgi:hypothetical protein
MFDDRRYGCSKQLRLKPAIRVRSVCSSPAERMADLPDTRRSFEANRSVM